MLNSNSYEVLFKVDGADRYTWKKSQKRVSVRRRISIRNGWILDVIFTFCYGTYGPLYPYDLFPPTNQPAAELKLTSKEGRKKEIEA